MSRAAQRLMRRGPVDSIDRMLMGTIGRALHPVSHRFAMPPLRAFYTAPGSVAVSPEEAFDQIALSLARTRPPALLDEYLAVRADLHAAYAQLATARFSDDLEFSLGEASSMVLYGLIRTLRPETVLETGVANGHSTFLILKALERNQRGTLHSFDVRAQVGALVHAIQKDQWVFHLCARQPVRREFAALVAGLSPIDFFLHDSDHSYANQSCEYQSVWPRLAPGGILASDDVDKSNAFLDFASDQGLEPVYLVDRWKIFAVAHDAARASQPERRSETGWRYD